MSGASSPEFEAWADKARAAKVAEVFFDRYGSTRVRKSSEGHTGACPKCGDGGKSDSDRFSINLKKNVWLCRQCGRGGDAIALVMNVEDLSFIDAVTEITGEPPPDREKGPAQEMAEDPAAAERKEERRAAEAKKETEEERRRRQLAAEVEALWSDALPFGKSLADRYLRSRAITLNAAQSEDLRFIRALPYHGFESPEAEAETQLGTFPAMIAAIRDVGGTLIGIHRTYLDPKTAAKLVPPGDLKRNLAKKVFGRQKGGHIRLGPIMPCMAIGEGIESTAGWYALGIGPEDVGMMCGINLGNLCGRSAGSIQHPKFASKRIPNGDPDLAAPGIVLPPEVKSVILLGDGDSDPAWTRMSILTAARRFRAEGREVSVCWPNDNEDFNDVARRMAA